MSADYSADYYTTWVEELDAWGAFAPGRGEHVRIGLGFRGEAPRYISIDAFPRHSANLELAERINAVLYAESARNGDSEAKEEA